MYTAARSSVTAGLVLTGASVLAVGPIAARPPVVEVPVVPAAASVATTALAKANPLVALIETLRDAEDAALGGFDTTVDNGVQQVINFANNTSPVIAGLNDNLYDAAIGAIGPGAFATLLAAFRDAGDAQIFGVGDAFTTLLLGTVTDHAIRTAITVNDDLADGLINALETGDPVQAFATLIGAFRDATDDAIGGFGNTVRAATDSIVSTITDNLAGGIVQANNDIAAAVIKLLGPGPLATVLTLVRNAEGAVVKLGDGSVDIALNALGSGVQTAGGVTTQFVDLFANTAIGLLTGKVMLASTGGLTTNVTAANVVTGNVTTGKVVTGNVVTGNVAAVPLAARRSLVTQPPRVSALTTAGDHHAPGAKPVARKK